MDTKKQILAPCPWCGMTPIVKQYPTVNEDEPMNVFVCPLSSSCQKTKLVVAFFGEYQKAVEAWNSKRELVKNGH